MKPIKFIPYIYVGDFPDDVMEEFSEADISTHYQDDIIGVDWGDADTLPLFQAWLIVTYGEDIKQHTCIALGST